LKATVKADKVQGGDPPVVSLLQKGNIVINFKTKPQQLG
jgi:hypothetical protein